jgi:hypothetical protein
MLGERVPAEVIAKIDTFAAEAETTRSNAILNHGPRRPSYR